MLSREGLGGRRGGGVGGSRKRVRVFRGFSGACCVFLRWVTLHLSFLCVPLPPQRPVALVIVSSSRLGER